jgi:hypothetical protein
MLRAFAFGVGDGQAIVGVRAYLFSPAAADYVRREEPAWQAWLQGLSVRPDRLRGTDSAAGALAPSRK